jgi:hypothetical protein
MTRMGEGPGAPSPAARQPPPPGLQPGHHEGLADPDRARTSARGPGSLSGKPGTRRRTVTVTRTVVGVTAVLNPKRVTTKP